MVITKTSTIDQLLNVLPHLVDRRLGIIKHVVEVPREAGAPGFFHFYAEASNTISFTAQRNFAHTGGAARDRTRALAKAVGEAVERYCSAIYDINDFTLTSYDKAPFQCIHPSAFTLFSDRQYAEQHFPYVRFEPSTLARWTSMVDLLTGESWNVPAAMVFLPYGYQSQCSELPILQPISTGLACHCSFAEAAIAAICEVIERDAFTITWQAQLRPPHIELETLSESNRDLVDGLCCEKSTVDVLNLTFDHGVPTILSVLRSAYREAPAMVFAAASDLSPEKAVQKSLEELAHTRRFSQQLKSLPALLHVPGYTNVSCQDDHVQLYCDHVSLPLAEFIWSSDKRISFDQIENVATGHPDADLAVLVNRIVNVGEQVLVAELTSSDISDLGLHVVRAVIPGFHPLFMGYRYRALGGDRLWTVPEKIGFPGRQKAQGDNQAPHPYP